MQEIVEPQTIEAVPWQAVVALACVAIAVPFVAVAALSTLVRFRFDPTWRTNIGKACVACGEDEEEWDDEGRHAWVCVACGSVKPEGGHDG